jgi:wyosine [tRNA(Phe)-imidazoG37] synthetase (radical SAM superfamily)
VSVKVDSAVEAGWRRLNRPAPELDFALVRDGIVRFAAEFKGDLVSETMLVAGYNDGPSDIEAVATFLGDAGFKRSYLSIPTRPTPYAAITAPDEATVNHAYQTLTRFVPDVEYLVGYEGDAFSATGNPKIDLLGITAVHPMRRSAVRDLLDRSGVSWDVVDGLIADGSLIETIYRGDTFFVRRFSRR